MGADPNWGKGSSRGQRFQQLVTILGRVGSCHIPIKSSPPRPGEAVSIGVTLSPQVMEVFIFIWLIYALLLPPSALAWAMSLGH